MRATLDIKFNRPLEELGRKDYISPGSYTIVLKDGTKKQFDFESSSAGTDIDDPSIYEVDLRGIDETYEDGNSLTIEDIKNIDHFEEIFIGYSDETGENRPLDVVEVLDFCFSDFDENDNYVCVEVPKEKMNVDCVYIDPCI